MAIVRESSAVTTGTGDPVTGDFMMSEPAGVVAGNVLVMSLATSNASIDAAVGWTLVASRSATPNNPRTFLYLRVSDGADPYAFSMTQLSIAFGGCIARYSGVDNATPQDATATDNGDSVAGLTATCLGLTTVTDGAMVISCAAANSGSTTAVVASGSHVEYFDTAAGKSCFGGDYTQTTAGATGDQVWTLSASRAWGALLMALRPAAAGGDPELLLIDGGKLVFGGMLLRGGLVRT